MPNNCECARCRVRCRRRRNVAGRDRVVPRAWHANRLEMHAGADPCAAASADSNGFEQVTGEAIANEGYKNELMLCIGISNWPWCSLGIKEPGVELSILA